MQKLTFFFLFRPRMIIMDSIQKSIEEYEAAKIIKKFLKQTRKAKKIKHSRRANILIANVSFFFFAHS